MRARAAEGVTVSVIGQVRTYAVVAALAPLLVAQGRWVRARTPAVPEAGGPRTGVVRGDGPTVRLAVIGESTAAGVGVIEQRDGLAVQLAEALGERAMVEWHVVARTGSTAAVVRRELAPDVPTHLDLIVLVLGVNDTLRLRTPVAWRREITELVRILASRLRSGGRVVLLGVPDFGTIPALPQPLRWVLRRHGRRLDAELIAIAAARPDVVHLVVPAMPDDAFCHDRFHPNARTYAVWAQDIAARLAD